MKLREAEMMGIIDKYCICIGNIEPRFDYSCRDKDIVIALDKLEHNIFDIPPIHFPMYNSSFNMRADTADLCLKLLNVFHPVMNKKYLSVTRYFIFNPFPDYLFIETMNFSDDRHSVGRWSIYYRKIAGSHQGELQCSRYWSGGKCEGVYICLHFFDLL